MAFDSDFISIAEFSLYNQYGQLNAGKPFPPFGIQPEPNSFFLIGCSALLTQTWAALAIQVDWQAPVGAFDFSDYYAAYNAASVDPVFCNSAFQLSASLLRQSQWQPMTSSNACLFQPTVETGGWTSQFVLQPASPMAPLSSTVSGVPGKLIYNQNTADGFIKLELIAPAVGFGASLYPQVFTSTMMNNASPTAPSHQALPNPPFTPIADSITLALRACCN